MEENFRKNKTAENQSNNRENIELTNAAQSVESPESQDQYSIQSESENGSTSLPPAYSN